MDARTPRVSAAAIIAKNGLLGALVGGAAGALYVNGHDGGPAFGPGALLGAVYGLAIGAVWVRWTRLRTASLNASGVAEGALAGILASCLVHTTFELWFGFRDALGKQFFGLVFGLVTGGLLGLVGGAARRKAHSPERRRPHTRPEQRQTHFRPHPAVDDLSEALVVVTGFGTRNSPTRDYAALAKVFGEARAPDFAWQVEVLLAELDSMLVDWSRPDFASAGDEAIRVMAGRHPELTEEALRALDWTFTFDWR